MRFPHQVERLTNVSAVHIDRVDALLLTAPGEAACLFHQLLGNAYGNASFFQVFPMFVPSLAW